MPDKLPINLPVATTGPKVVHAVNTDDTTDTPQGTSQKVIVLEASVFRPVYGTMAITQSDTADTNPVNTITVLAHPSATDVLNPPSAPVVAGPGPFGGYYRMTGFTQEGIAREITFGTDELILPVDGVYILPIGWGGFRHNQNNATVGFVLGIERAGQIIFSQRPTSNLKPNLDRLSNVSGGGQIGGLAGDKISVWVASDVSGDITLGNSNVTVHMLEDTTPPAP